MYITKFGGYTLPTEQYEMSETQGGTRRGVTRPLGGAGGSLDDYGNGPDPLAEDIINKSFIIEAASTTALQTAVDNFVGEMMLSQNEWRQGARVLISTLPDGTTRQTFAKCVEARARWEYFNINQAWVPVDVTWRRSWPVWETFADLLYLGDHLGDFANGATQGWDMGQSVTEQAVNTSPHTFTITNSGNARVLTGVIEFDGAVTDPTVTNNRNKFEFSWTGSLGADDRLTLTLASRDLKKNGRRIGQSSLAVGEKRGQLGPMALEPGSNSFSIVSTSPNCTFRYYFAKGWS